MNFSVEETKEPPKDWDSNLLQFETGSIYHSTNYAEYARKWLKWDPKFYRLTDSKGNVVLQNLLLEDVIEQEENRIRGEFEKMLHNENNQGMNYPHRRMLKVVNIWNKLNVGKNFFTKNKF